VNDLRKMRSKEALVNREVQKGDKAEVDIEVFQNKVPIEGGQGKNQAIIIGEGNFIPGFEDKLIGMKKGEEKEFELKFPKEYFQKSLAGKPAEFKIKLNSVFKIEMPEANDEFAKSFGTFKTMKDLEDQISKNLEEEANNKERQRVELEMLESIANKSKFGEFPDDLEASEIDKMIHELKHDFEKQGLKYEDYLQSIKKSEEELRKSFEPRAEKRVKTALLIRKIAETENIKATDDEIKIEIEKSKQTYQQQGNEEMIKQLETPDYRSFVKNVMVNQKVIDMLYKSATE
ncbi:trigger factor, partial [Patescibacteria group bacterium]|nr:trigger factor [Patescibacteria group bacterium]